MAPGQQGHAKVTKRKNGLQTKPQGGKTWGEQERRDCGDPARGRKKGGEKEITEKEMRADRASEWGTRGEEERIAGRALG